MRQRHKMISIILPTFNESSTGFLPQILQELSKVKDAEIILIDGGSSDDTLEVLKEFNLTAKVVEGSTRSARLKKGIELATGDILLLHHPRSLVSAESIMSLDLLPNLKTSSWGCFTHGFDVSHPLLRFTSWYSNHIRCDFRGIVYLDHCFFLHRDLVPTAMKLPDVEIFEDTEISKLLRQQSHPIRRPNVAVTSAVRFVKNGVLRQSLLNQLLKLGYFLNIPHETMNRLYEKGLRLNS